MASQSKRSFILAFLMGGFPHGRAVCLHHQRVLKCGKWEKKKRREEGCRNGALRRM